MRLVELLKQEPYNPIPFEKQVIALYAGTRGYLDDIPVSAVRKFEKELYTFLDTEKPDLLEKIRTVKDLTKEIEEEIKKAIEEFKQKFVP